MDHYFGEGDGWDVSQYPLSDQIQYGDQDMNPEENPDSSYNLDDALAEYTINSVDKSSPHSHSTSSRYEHSAPTGSFPETERTDRRTMILQPMPSQRRRLRAISPDAAERRRRQNRASQIAFRERSRKKLEDLHRELSESVRYNQQMYQTMKGLLEQAEVFKSTIELALSSLPPSNPEPYDRTPSDSEASQQHTGNASA